MAIEVGNIFEGRVTGVKPFGAFVALPEGRVGMVHISEVSNEYVQDIAAVLHDGDIDGLGDLVVASGIDHP